MAAQVKSAVLVGSDPEIFVRDETGIKSAIGKVGGSKSEPFPVPFGGLQEDNVLLEFNIDPAATFEEFDHHITSVIESARQQIQPHGLLLVEGVSSHLYYDGQLESFGQQAFIFGCEPDYNAWTGKQNHMPTNVDPKLRTAGGHIHIGFPEGVEVRRRHQEAVGKACDVFLGLPSVLLDTDSRRRQLYGKAGSVRFKPYGIEYRTLSNFWIFTQAGRLWAYTGAQLAYKWARKEVFEEFLERHGDSIQMAINTNDATLVSILLDQLDALRRGNE